MFGDPITITQSSVDFNFRRVGVSNGQAGALYRTDDRLRSIGIAHARTGRGREARDRHEVRLDLRKVAADPYTSGLNNQYSGSVYFVINVPAENIGISVTDVVTEWDKLTKFLAAGSVANDNLRRLVQGES